MSKWTLAITSKEKLISWFDKNKRKLPWREDKTPYRVWISEVMLQQTQVKTVMDYYERWMKRFPTIKSLAEADEEEVIKMWEGLGYYSRARSLLKAAREILEKFDGQFPSDKKELCQLTGLGPYTASAILNFAFSKREPLVDGNVMRVICRFYAISEPIDKGPCQKRVWKIVEEILPEKRSFVFTEALMELGATVCQKKPNCKDCPLKQSCQAYLQNLSEKIPFKEKKLKITKIQRKVAVVYFFEKEKPYFLVEKVEKKLMKDLYEFPFTDEEIDEDALREFFEKKLKLPMIAIGKLKTEKQSFTRYQVTLYPYLFTTKKLKKCAWKTREDLEKLAFSSGHRRIANQIINHENFT